MTPLFRRPPASAPPETVRVPDALRLATECERALAALSHPSTIGRYNDPGTRLRLQDATKQAKSAVAQIKHVLDTSPGAGP